MAQAFWKRYLVGSMGYGAVHKFAILWDAKVDGTGNERRQMLAGEKLSVFTLGMVYAPVLWPAWIMNDLDRLDIYMGGKRPEDYGYGDQRYDGLFDYVMG